MNKICAVLFLCTGFLAQGAFAAGANDADSNVKKGTVAYGSSATSVKSVRDVSKLEEARSCGAYVSSKTRNGYAFGSSVAAATSKAMEMCGSKSCAVVVAQCED